MKKYILYSCFIFLLIISSATRHCTAQSAAIGNGNNAKMDISNDERYYIRIAKARLALREKDSAEARKFYQEAGIFRPGDKFVLIQVEKLNNPSRQSNNAQNPEESGVGQADKIIDSILDVANKIVNEAYHKKSIADFELAIEKFQELKKKYPELQLDITTLLDRITNLKIEDSTRRVYEQKQKYETAKNKGTTAKKEKKYAEALDAFKEALDLLMNGMLSDLNYKRYDIPDIKMEISICENQVKPKSGKTPEPAPGPPASPAQDTLKTNPR